MRKTFLEKCINLRLCRVALVLLFLVPAISSLQACLLYTSDAADE